MATRGGVVRHAACIPSPPYHRGYGHISGKRYRGYSSSIISDHRQRVEILSRDIERVCGKPEYLVDILGAHRRGEQVVQAATILIVGEKDDQTLSSPRTASDYLKEKANSLTSRLIEEGILKDSKGASKVTLADDATFPVDIHYATKPCHGAARLLLTGHDSYARFLRLMAMEAGLLLTESGLWKTLQRRTQATKQESRLSHSVPAGLAIQPIDGEGEESEGDRRMRETRKEMGLPEGLDLSLDLGSGYSAQHTQQTATFEEVEAALAQQLQSQSGDFECITGKGGGSEHDILDVLGLVWLPPSMRKLREPESRA